MEGMKDLKAGLVTHLFFDHSDLSGLDLRGIILENVSFTHSRFTGALLHHSQFTNVDLTHSDLRNVVAVKSNWQEVRLVNANLSGADLTGASCRGDLGQAICHGTLLVEADLSDCNLFGADLSCADLRDGCLMNAFADQALFKQARVFNTNCRKLIGNYTNFANADIVGADFREASLKGACFDSTHAKVTDFRSAILDLATFCAADLSEADFRKASLNGTSFANATTWLMQTDQAAGEPSASCTSSDDAK